MPGGLIRRLCIVGLLALALAGAPVPPGTAHAQAPEDLQSDFLLIDQERLFAGSLFGQRVLAVIEAESASLAEENRRIEARLIEEERALTEQRATLPPEEFRALADEFDARVTQIRIEQDRKARALGERETVEQRRFLDAIVPILGRVMQDYGALALLDRRTVFLSDDRLDVTDLLIERIDAVLGDGSGQLLNTDLPSPEPGSDAEASE